METLGAGTPASGKQLPEEMQALLRKVLEAVKEYVETVESPCLPGPELDRARDLAVSDATSGVLAVGLAYLTVQPLAIARRTIAQATPGVGAFVRELTDQIRKLNPDYRQEIRGIELGFIPFQRTPPVVVQ